MLRPLNSYYQHYLLVICNHFYTHFHTNSIVVREYTLKYFKFCNLLRLVCLHTAIFKNFASP